MPVCFVSFEETHPSCFTLFWENKLFALCHFEDTHPSCFTSFWEVWLRKHIWGNMPAWIYMPVLFYIFWGNIPVLFYFILQNVPVLQWQSDPEPCQKFALNYTEVNEGDYRASIVLKERVDYETRVDYRTRLKAVVSSGVFSLCSVSMSPHHWGSVVAETEVAAAQHPQLS